MRKLFLASIAAKTLDYLKEILSKDPKECKVIFIPTAADLYEDKSFVEEDRKKLVELGYKVEDFDIKGKDEKQLLEKFKFIDIIFIAGGNTFYLLEKVKESGFNNIIKELLDKGIVYVGSSAGAVIAGPSIEPIRLLDHPEKAPNLKSFEGLNIVDFVPLPHFDNEKYGPKCEKVMEEYKEKFKLLPIKDLQAAIVEDNEVRFVGMG